MNRILIGTCLSLLIASCTRTGDTCEGIDLTPERYQVTVAGISDVAVFRELTDGTMQALNGTETVSIDQLVIRVQLDYTRKLRTTRNKHVNPLDWIIGTANACSLIPYEGDIQTRVTSADLFSDESLGDTFAPGASLGAAFEIIEVPAAGIDYGDQSPTSGGTLASFASDYSPHVGLIYELRPINQEGATLSPQSEISMHQFTFSISLDTGEMFTGVSDLIQVSGFDN